MDTVYNTGSSEEALLETTHLFQPRGPGTAWYVRIKTPAALVGDPNPFTRGNPPFRAGETRISLNGQRSLRIARGMRDQIIAGLRALVAAKRYDGIGSIKNALEIAEQFKALPDDPDDLQRGAWIEALEQDAERLAERIGLEDASQWYRIATGQAEPQPLLKDVFDQYLSVRGPTLSLSTRNNFRTAAKEFLIFAGEKVELPAVTRKMCRRFVREFLPGRKNPRAPEGQGPATIKRKVSLLRAVWAWAEDEDIISKGVGDPWEKVSPSPQEIEDARIERQIYEPQQMVALLAAAPVGSALGDVIRIALLTGVRLEEVASLEAIQVEPGARWYTVALKRKKASGRKGKSPAARRVVPLVDVAQEIVKRRTEAVNREGALFPELPIRPSSGKRGPALTKAFTALRRKVLGKDTDRELDLHAFRHTWRTAARRARIDMRGTLEMGGWKVTKSNDAPYDHGLEEEQYREEQQKVVNWLRVKGYLG